MRKTPALLVCVALDLLVGAARTDVPVTNRITYRLPYDGSERTWRVTLAATPKGEPNWIVSTIVSGAVRSVNERNRGEFIEEWDGLDDNAMPVPPGEYAFKGIFMPAEKWKIDGQYHSLTARYLSSPGDSWTPRPEDDDRFPPIHGQVLEPIRDVCIADDGKAVFLSGYIENWYNPFVVDMHRSVGIDQVVGKLPSAGREGGHLVACDTKHIWMVRGGEVHRLSRDPRSDAEARGYSINVLSRVRGQSASDLTCATFEGQPHLFVCEAYAKRLSVLHGMQGARLRTLENINAVAAVVDRVTHKHLYLLARNTSGAWSIQATPLKDGLPEGDPRTLFELEPSVTSPSDLEMDRDGYFYVVSGRQVRKFAADGKTVLTIGKDIALQGKYDPEVLIRPHRLACWTDAEGKDRIVIIELGGPMRISEWSCVEGKLLREWLLCQNAASGFCTDPEAPEHVYATSLLSPELVRYRVDYATGDWKVDAVWEGMCHVDGTTSFPGGRLFPRILRHNGQKYLAFGGGAYRSRGQWLLYRFAGNRWLPSAGAINNHCWHDANGDGRLQEDEVGKKPLAGYTGSYWGDAFQDDLSLLAAEHGTSNIRRLQPRGFDRHGNPVYDGAAWEVIAVDAMMSGIRAGRKLPLLKGGNEIGTAFWHWFDVAGAADTGYYVASVSPPDNPGGIDEAGYVGAQWKLTCWEPNPAGADKYRMKWRTGRKALRVAAEGEVYASLHVTPPVHGILGVHDGNGLYHLFTADGLYVDTLMNHSLRFGAIPGGMYTHGGGSYFGKHFVNPSNGKVYVLMGRASNNIYEVPSWRPGVVQPLEITSREIALPAGLIAPPNTVALKLRQDLQSAQPALKVVPDAAEFRIARDEPALDGSLAGWASARVIEFPAAAGTVQVRCLFDMEHLYLHYRLRKNARIATADSGDPAKLLSGRGDLLSFCFQGDSLARPATVAPRPGDAQLVFGIVNENRKLNAVALGMFPHWEGEGAQPLDVQSAHFAHVARLDDVQPGFRIDEDARGFTLAVKVPHAALPLRLPITPQLRSTADFGATVNGATFRWSGSQEALARLSPSAWGPVRFQYGASEKRTPLALFVPQPTAIKAGQAFKLAGIQAPEGREITQGLLHFRARGDQEFLSLKLQRGFIDFEATIPGEYTKRPFEYCIEVRLAGDDVATFPAQGAALPTVVTPDSTPPEPVAIFEATQTKAHATSLRWSRANDDVGIASYQLYRDASKEAVLAATSPLALLAAARLAFDDVRPPQDAPLWYRLAPVDVVGRVGESRVISVEPAKDLPPRNNLHLYASSGPRGVMLSWHGTLDPDARRLTILRADGPSRTYRQITVIDNPSAIGRWVDPTALRTQEYHYIGVLADHAGKESEVNTPAWAKPGRYIRRINCGGGEVVDLDGLAWEADEAVNPGLSRWLTAEKIVNAPAELQPVFQSERWADGGLRYRFAVPPGRYQIVLSLAETNPEFAGVGRRTFDVVINGNKEHESVDVFHAVGANTAWQLLSTVTVTEGNSILLELQRRAVGPALKGIEIRGY